MKESDVIIVGAGVAGAATAYLLGRSGHRVLLLDRARFPRPKVCGEGLMPAGLQILQRLGIDPRTLPGQSFPGIRFCLEHHPPLALNFGDLDPGYRGLAVSRESLDARLAQRAARLPQVEFRQGTTVTSCRVDAGAVQVSTADGVSTLRGRVLVAADGIRSRFHSVAGVRRLASSGRRFALRALIREYAHETDWVDVHCRPDGEAYVAPLTPRSARVTLLCNRGSARRPESNASWFEREVARFPEIRRRMLSPPERVDVTAPVSRTVSACHARRLLLVGDAAGTVDPVTGQGMTLALRDAVLAGSILDAALTTDRLSAADLRCFSDARRAYFKQASELSDRMLMMLKHPWLLMRARRSLAASGDLRRRLLASAVDPDPSSGLRWSDRLRLVAGF